MNSAIFQVDDLAGSDMNFWSFVYFHGKLQSHFDAKGCIGDLVSCSVPLNEFPLGSTYVGVDGMPSLCYLWEEEGGTRRRGLIIALDDDPSHHEYARECMGNQVSNL